MLVQDLALLSITCQEQEIPNVLQFMVRCLNKKFPCIEINKKEFIKQTNKEKPSYIAKVNDGYSYVMDRQSVKEYMAKGNIPDISKAASAIKTNYVKYSDEDRDIDPKYFTIESNYIIPFDFETKDSIEPRLYVRIILNKMLPFTEEGILVEMAKMMSRHRTTEVILIKRATGNAADKRGMEMYFKYKNNHIIESKAAQAGLFSEYREKSGIDIAQIMAQIDRNIDISMAPKIIKDLELMKKGSQLMLSKLKEMGIDDDDIEEDNITSTEDIDKLIEKNKLILKRIDPRKDGKSFNMYLRITEEPQIKPIISKV